MFVSCKDVILYQQCFMENQPPRISIFTPHSSHLDYGNFMGGICRLNGNLGHPRYSTRTSQVRVHALSDHPAQAPWFWAMDDSGRLQPQPASGKVDGSRQTAVSDGPSTSYATFPTRMSASKLTSLTAFDLQELLKNPSAGRISASL